MYCRASCVTQHAHVAAASMACAMPPRMCSTPCSQQPTRLGLGGGVRGAGWQAERSGVVLVHASLRAGRHNWRLRARWVRVAHAAQAAGHRLFRMQSAQHSTAQAITTGPLHASCSSRTRVFACTFAALSLYPFHSPPSLAQLIGREPSAVHSMVNRLGEAISSRIYPCRMHVVMHVPHAVREGTSNTNHAAASTTHWDVVVYGTSCIANQR